MSTAKRLAPVMLFLAAMMLVAGTASAQVEGTCTYNAVTQELEYAVSGGSAGATYTVTMTAEGCVALDGTPADLNGPADAQSIGLLCNEAGAMGKVTVEICEGVICFAAFEIGFACDGTCEIRELQGAVPSSGQPALAILVLLLLGAGVWFVRRRTA